MEDFLRRSSGNRVRVRSPQAAELATAIGGRAAEMEVAPDGALIVFGLSCPEIGDLAAANGLAVHELVAETASLEEAYLELTHESAEFRADQKELQP